MSGEYRQVAIPDVPLGGGWVASVVQYAQALSSAIVLLTIQKNHVQRRLRLDIGKGMFIDPRPIELSEEAARAVTNYIVTNVTTPRGIAASS